VITARFVPKKTNFKKRKSKKSGQNVFPIYKNKSLSILKICKQISLLLTLIHNKRIIKTQKQAFFVAKVPLSRYKRASFIK